MPALLKFMSALLGPCLLGSGVDTIAQVLLGSKVGGARTATLHAAAPWGVERGRAPAVVFHFVAQGACWLRTREAEPLRLEAGDVVMLLDGAGHAVSSDRSGPLTSDDALIAGTEGGAGPRTRLLCAGYRPGRALPASLRAQVPPVLHIRPARSDGLAETARMLAEEATADRPGSRIVVDRLVDVLVVQALRGWAVPTQDLPVAAAMTALHDEFDRPWTLDALARRCGVSRATLTRRFTAVTGEPPLTYLRRRRMEVAANRLLESDDPLATVAELVGYASEFSFSRTFTRTFGVAPGHFRRTGR
ncbi:AraC family transcriptional regulator [Amycolatopsis magusensis]|uniref:AraC family transcriptional regulator n=1 Tax=Amycolatopsis magusensis TaxID=882444 RepID=UPI003C2BD77E